MGKISRFLERSSLAARKARWRVFNNHAPNAKAVYVFGAQRSGTTLLLDSLNQSLECEVLGETSKAMTKFRIKDDAVVQSIVRSSRHKAVVFKPLTDSHRASSFLDLLPNSVAIWAYRRVEDRALSAVVKFGDHNLQVLRGLANRKGLDTWQAQGLTDENLELIRSFDYSSMPPETAAAIFWYIRNSLFFSTGLDLSTQAIPLAYEDLVARPGEIMRSICKFIGCDFRERMIRDIHSHSVRRRELALSERVQELSASMYARLHSVQEQRWKALDL